MRGERAQQRFCVITSGRAGSTWLMDRLAEHDDVALVRRFIDSDDDELLNPLHIDAMRTRFGDVAASSSRSLVDGFYRAAGDWPFAGFKTMPDRHTDDAGFMLRPDIRFIVLLRESLVDTVASFLVAAERHAWRRGAQPPACWTFQPAHHPRATGLIDYLLRCQHALRRIPGAIQLSYEQLCTPGFRSEALDSFFARPLQFSDAREPTDARRYVSNHAELLEFVRATVTTLEAR